MKTKVYIRLMILLVSAVTAFHVCLILKLIPYDIAWGGRLKSDKEMYMFEAISILVNFFLFAVLLIKGNYLKLRINEKIVNAILWVFFAIFILNTIGNLLAKTNFEKVFGIVTLILVVGLWQVLKKKRIPDTDVKNQQ